MVSELISKYIWLIRTFIKAGDRGLSLGEISHRWERRWNAEYPRRSFNNHRSAIEEIFGIRIECNRSDNRYFIRFGEEIEDSGAGAAWLIDTFTVNDLLSLGKERLSGRVSVENIPSGRKFLTTAMEAMTDNSEVAIVYRKYTGPATETFHVRPYAVKEFEKRWYLVGFCHERGAMRVYGLDRIMEMTVTGTRFRMPENFDIDEVFAQSFGIYLPQGENAVTIKFMATAREYGYLTDLPIHRSQQLLERLPETPEGHFAGGALFSIRVIPDDNLIMEFCRHGDRIMIVEPPHIREQVRQEHLRALHED